ncbi:hypothetical protein FGLOB1_2507 [Fusarium globosum]|uniref:Uncharacterized protein n=1 Tax=Fusarium globosum TaxID=78864 RepID=A0A8H5YPQ7_9HYPO|nr:hypothetical protein FGLOB1_2507 [Fusarium globosum]
MTIIRPSRPKNPHLARQARSAIRPREGSLWWILRQHPGQALFQKPDRWSDLHNKVLGVSWYELKTDDTLRTISVNEEDIAKLQDYVPELLKARYKDKFTALLQMTLETLWPEVFSMSNIPAVFDIRFDTRIYKKAVKVDAAWVSQSRSPASISRSPNENAKQASHLGQMLICYAEMRRWLRPKSLTENDPIKRLNRLRHNLLLSPNPHHDARFVGILLAMAQSGFYAQSSTERLPVNFTDTKMRIITLDRDAGEFIVYKGHITKEFLIAFDAPFEAELNEEIRLRDPTITYTRVPLRPVLDLKRRLGKALGREIVGDLSK